MSTPTLTAAECAELKSGRDAKAAIAAACPTKASLELYAGLHSIANTTGPVDGDTARMLILRAAAYLRRAGLPTP